MERIYFFPTQAREGGGLENIEEQFKMKKEKKRAKKVGVQLQFLCFDGNKRESEERESVGGKWENVVDLI